MKRRQTGRTPSALRLAASGAIERYRLVLDQQDSRTLLSAGVFSGVFDWLNFVALMALAYDLSGGAIGVGGMLALRLVPSLVFQGLAGTVVDRARGKRLLIATQLAMAVLAWSFLLLDAFENIWLLYLLVVLLEIANTFARPAFIVQLVNTVRPANRGAVNGLLGMTMTIAQFAGALLGALILEATGATPLFIINGLTFLGIAILVQRVHFVERASESDETAPPRQQLSPAGRGEFDRGHFGQIAADSQANAAPRPHDITANDEGFAGYLQLLRRPDVFIYSVLTLTVSLLIQGATALFEVRARSMGRGDGGGGAFFAAVAVGFLVGGAIAGAGRYRSRKTLYLIAGSEIVGAIGLIVFGFANSFTVAFVALLVTGISAEMSEIPAFTFFQNRLPGEMYGRFFSLFLTANAAGGLAGALAGPLLEKHISEWATLILLAIPGLVTAATLIVVARFGIPDEPLPMIIAKHDQPVPAD